MKTALDRIDANLAGLRTWAEEGTPLPFIDEGHDFLVGPPMEEEELRAIECRYELELPPEYRGFLARFGDTSVGPGNRFRRVNDGLTAKSAADATVAPNLHVLDGHGLWCIEPA